MLTTIGRAQSLITVPILLGGHANDRNLDDRFLAPLAKMGIGPVEVIFQKISSNKLVVSLSLSVIYTTTVMRENRKKKYRFISERNITSTVEESNDKINDIFTI